MILEIIHINGNKKKVSKVGFVGILTIDEIECFYYQTHFKGKFREHWLNKDEVKSFRVREGMCN